MWEKRKVLVPYGDEVWYAFSMKMVDPIPQEDHRYLMAQWKRQIRPEAQKSYSPFLALRLDKGKIIFTTETDEVKVEPLGTAERPDKCKPGETLVDNRPHDEQTRALVAWQADMAPSAWRYHNGCTSEIKLKRYGPLPAANSGWIDFVFDVKTGPRGQWPYRHQRQRQAGGAGQRPYRACKAWGWGRTCISSSVPTAPASTRCGR